MKPTNTNLTPQEFKVAALTAGGFAVKEIADKLRRSVHTIMTQRKSINRKLGINKDTELTRWWFCQMFSITADQIAEKMRLAGITMVMFIFSLHAATTFDDHMRRTRRGRRSDNECVDTEYIHSEYTETELLIQA